MTVDALMGVVDGGTSRVWAGPKRTTVGLWRTRVLTLLSLGSCTLAADAGLSQPAMTTVVRWQQRCQVRTVWIRTGLAGQTGSAVLTRTRIRKRNRRTKGTVVGWG